MDAKAQTTLLHSQWTNFNSNTGALYTFFDNLVEIADKLDQERKRKLASGLAEIFGENAEEVEKEILQHSLSVDDWDVVPDLREDASLKEMIKQIQDEDFKARTHQWEIRHPHKSYKLARLIFSLFGNPPISGFILRKSLLITAVTSLEVAIESMYVNHYLLKGCSKEEAIDKAEKLGVKSWVKRLDNLTQIGIPQNIASMCKEEILEVVSLRNLFIHNDGVVDQEILSRSPADLQSRLKPGNVLVVSTKRLQNVLDLLFSYGFVLCQFQWSLYEQNSNERQEKIDQLILTSFDEKRYSFIIQLTERLMTLDLPSNIKQRLLVDKAVAFRELNNPDQVSRIVTELEEAEHDWQIAIAIATLKKDYPALRAQLAQAHSKYDIQKSSHWPLFEPIRDEVWFKIAFTKRRKSIDLPQNKRKRR
jgi:hypothetical protein